MPVNALTDIAHGPEVRLLFWKHLPDPRGFTLVELIAALLIVAILGTMILSRASSVQGFQIAAEFDRLKTHLRFAQKKALKANSRWGVHFESSASYWLFRDNVADQRKFPDQETSTVTLTALRITNPPVTVMFDNFGSPGASSVDILTNKGAIPVQGGTGFVE